MSRLYGNLPGLKPDHLRRLENLYRRRTPDAYVVTPELARDLMRLSLTIHRQIGLLIDRAGRVTHVVVGDAEQIVIPDTPEYRTLPGRLKGLRCVHTHLADEPLTDDDLTDLAHLRLDLMAALTALPDGGIRHLHMAHILPGGDAQSPFRQFDPFPPDRFNLGCLALIRAVEDEMARIRAMHGPETGRERAVLISVSVAPRQDALDSLAELRELARSGGLHVVDSILQQRKQIDSRFLMGRGKLKELNLIALQKGVGLLIFDQELNPSQMRAITDRIDMKAIDRTQLILDIFAQRAQSREGKLQVELAQLKYLLPRLITKNTAMSRLTGGIGGRGPGETKLEINRRRARERIGRLEKTLLLVRQHRKQQRSLRRKKRIPVISIIGYTNAGKSTLLNTLTHSRVLAEQRLFATLDPPSKRLRFPRDIEVIITDTVGFIRDLPQDPLVAFRATLQGLESADLLLHVVDISHPRFREQIEVVEGVLRDLELDRIPVIRVLNKMDRVGAGGVESLAVALQGIPVCARDPRSLMPLIHRMEEAVEGLMPLQAAEATPQDLVDEADPTPNR